MIMKISKRQFGFSKKLLVLSMLAAFGPAHADEEEIAQLINPENSISVGLNAATGGGKDRTIFTQYNGLRKNDTNLLLDINFHKLNKETGTSIELIGNNLGLDNREIKFEYDHQGDFEVYAIYNELTRHDMRTINTGLQGAGTTAPTVASLAAPGAGTDLNLSLQRKGLTLVAEKWLAPNLLFTASFKNEDKDGARLSGTGIMCSAGGIFVAYSRFTCGTTGAMLMLPEPINSTTRQFEAKLNFSGENFLLTGGYYGSFYTNANGSLNPAVNGNLWNPNGSILVPGTGANTLGNYLTQPLALPPDNQAHQLSVSGNYTFTPTTRATFKYAYTHATQNEDFGSMGLAGGPAGVGSLGGAVDSSLAQLGVTARPLPKLSMLANLRYEDKADKTPLAKYDADKTGALLYTNDLNSSRKLTGKLEASYQLPDNYRATLGVDYATVHRDRPVGTFNIPDLALALSALREDTQELGYRAELRRSMSDTLNATVSYGQSLRDGGNWLQLVPGAPAVSDAAIYKATGTFPMTMTDRTRDKLKLSAGWTPTEDLSLQFMIEDGQDKYTAPSEKGLRDTGVRSYGMDAALNLSDNWKLTGYVNQGIQTFHVDHSMGYMAELENVNTSLGIGVAGKPSSRLTVGGDLSYLNDSNRYKQGMSSGVAPAGGGLPDVTYRLTSLKLFGTYALEKNTDIRVDLAHQSAKFDEWSWGYNGIPFAYSDNTTVSMQQNQNVTFLGARYIYKFR